MKYFRAGAVALLAGALAGGKYAGSAGHGHTKNFEKTLTLGANQTLSLESKFGEVTDSRRERA